MCEGRGVNIFYMRCKKYLQITGICNECKLLIINDICDMAR